MLVSGNSQWLYFQRLGKLITQETKTDCQPKNYNLEIQTSKQWLLVDENWENCLDIIFKTGNTAVTLIMQHEVFLSLYHQGNCIVLLPFGKKKRERDKSSDIAFNLLLTSRKTGAKFKPINECSFHSIVTKKYIYIDAPKWHAIGKYNILKFRTDDGKDKRRYTKINDKIKHFL